jgi:hypothetical protein
MGIQDTLLAYTYARALMESNKTQAAADAFRTLTVSQPLYWPAHANLGSALFELGDLTGSLQAAQEAIEVLEEEDKAKVKGREKEGGGGVEEGDERADGDTATSWETAVGGGGPSSLVVSHESLAELYLQKGVVLLELPPKRCAGASCREYAAQVSLVSTSCSCTLELPGVTQALCV